MSSRITYKQDLPPKGGYVALSFFKRKAERAHNFFFVSGVMIFYAGYGMWIHRLYQDKTNRLLKLEMIEGQIAMEPVILAERDRMQLRQYRRNRDWERELMKDVPGWEVGKCWDIPVYHNKQNVWMQPYRDEFYAHNRYRDYYRRAYEKFYLGN